MIRMGIYKAILRQREIEFMGIIGMIKVERNQSLGG